MSALIESIAGHPALTWAVIGLIMAVIEVLAPGGFFVPFAVSGIVVAGAAAIGILPDAILWQAVLFLALGLALIPVCRKLLLRYSDKTPDINKY